MKEADSDDRVTRAAEDDLITVPTEDVRPLKFDEGLGSLAQSARSNHLRSASTIMYVIGVLTVDVGD